MGSTRAKPGRLKSRKTIGVGFLDAPGPWFGVKTLYMYYKKIKGKWIPTMSEERVVLIQANLASDAVLIAEREAEAYAYKDKDSKVEYLGEGAYHVIDDIEIKPGCEIFSRFHPERRSATPESVLRKGLGRIEASISTSKLGKARKRRRK